VGLAPPAGGVVALHRMSDYHLDCFSGLAGDMFLGACLDLGMPLEVISEAVEGLDLPGVAVESRSSRRGGLRGTRFRVLIDGRPIEGPDSEEAPAEAEVVGGAEHVHPEHGRPLSDILQILRQSALAAEVRERAESLFVRLGEAEAKVHGVPLDKVHFHEVGAVDSIVDLVGAAAAVAHLDPGSLTCGRVNVGSGTVQTSHGVLPVPTPATAELLTDVPICSSPGGELLTPTGAVLLAELVDSFVEFPAFRMDAVGYGLGHREIDGRPNAARLFRGRSSARRRNEEIVVVEAQVDDLPGEGFGFVMESLFDEGALDVYFTPVQMKKSRPATLVTVLCSWEGLERVTTRLLAETGSLGCRYYPVGRFEAERQVGSVETPWGPVAVKRASFLGRTLVESPEYEDCRRLALEKGVAWREIYQAALGALSGARKG
jgi:uncharacterized protein (TIGR00299 family) protein